MSDWLIKLEKDKTTLFQFKKKTQIKYISSNSTLQFNLFIKSQVHWGIYGGHHKNTCPLGEGSEIKILKAIGGPKKKGHA